jgi:hypothetical protein
LITRPGWGILFIRSVNQHGAGDLAISSVFVECRGKGQQPT